MNIKYNCFYIPRQLQKYSLFFASTFFFLLKTIKLYLQLTSTWLTPALKPTRSQGQPENRQARCFFSFLCNSKRKTQTVMKHEHPSSAARRCPRQPEPKKLLSLCLRSSAAISIAFPPHSDLCRGTNKCAGRVGGAAFGRSESPAGMPLQDCWRHFANNRESCGGGAPEAVGKKKSVGSFAAGKQ